MATHWVGDAATLRGDRSTNQDQVVLVDGAAAVLDGATSWLRDPADPRDGGWYARMLGSVLTAELPGYGRPLVDVLAAAIAQVRDAYGLRAGESPYSTATLARWDDEQVEVLVLCDSPALVVSRSGATTLVADERLAATAHPERAAYAEHLRAGRGFDADFGGLIAAVQRAERPHRNVEGGFWVAETLPEAAYRALSRTWPARDVASVALMSDGAAAGVLEYGLTDWGGMDEDVRVTGPARWLARVHAAELQDPDGTRWPRTKRHDDKSLVLVTALDAPAG